MAAQRYIYSTITRKRDIYGNPRNQINVYRMKNNRPHLLNSDPETVGYRDDKQAVCDIIDKAEHHKSGWAWDRKTYEGMTPKHKIAVYITHI
jgi:hypothetical protein